MRKPANDARFPETQICSIARKIALAGGMPRTTAVIVPCAPHKPRSDWQRIDCRTGESGMELVPNWGARPVFITSTFQDMQAERDWLWDFVRLAIEDRLRARRRHLEWIDLRLGAGAAQAETEMFTRALAALREDTRAYWHECLTERPGDGLTYTRTADALKPWIERHWKEWFDDPIAELEHRDAIRDQALGAAYAAYGLDAPARYEVHLDRKLERTLAMLIRLRELRRPAVPP
jgi:hypothetical protein